MKIAKIIVLNDQNEEVEFQIQEGVGIFITTDNQRLILPTTNDVLNMEVVRSAISKWQ